MAAIGRDGRMPHGLDDRRSRGPCRHSVTRCDMAGAPRAIPGAGKSVNRQFRVRKLSHSVHPLSRMQRFANLVGTRAPRAPTTSSEGGSVGHRWRDEGGAWAWSQPSRALVRSVTGVVSPAASTSMRLDCQISSVWSGSGGSRWPIRRARCPIRGTFASASPPGPPGRLRRGVHLEHSLPRRPATGWNPMK